MAPVKSAWMKLADWIRKLEEFPDAFHIPLMHLFKPDVLVASLIWGSIGSGYFIYGWRQQAFLPMVAGVALVAASYFAESGLSMSLIGIGIIGGHLVARRFV